MKLEVARREHYRKLAKKMGYVSRAAFKLHEVNVKYKLMKRGYRVADFGSAPGGWLQVASKAVGPSGVVFGFDIVPIKVKLRNVKFVQLDVLSPEAEDVIVRTLSGPVDVVLSDLSPNLTGTWELDHARQVDLTLSVIKLLPKILKNGGSAFLKVFQGELLEDLRRTLGGMFLSVDLVKPRASRPRSGELYFLCRNLREGAEAPIG